MCASPFECACFAQFLVCHFKIFKMADVTDLRNITKFNGQNFQLWKFQLNAVFLVSDLLRVVEGRDKKLAPVAEGATDTNAAVTQAWIKKDAKGMFILSSSMDYSQLDYLVTCTSAHEM